MRAFVLTGYGAYGQCPAYEMADPVAAQARS